MRTYAHFKMPIYEMRKCFTATDVEGNESKKMFSNENDGKEF